MPIPIFLISDSVIGKTRLPNLSVPLELTLGPEGESALEQLNRFLQGLHWSDEKMKMIRHDHVGMKRISQTIVVLQSIEDQVRPALMTKERFTPLCLR
jgi:hypothetical protein